jgi:uncharacterized MAPEG superfamily protein
METNIPVEQSIIQASVNRDPNQKQGRDAVKQHQPVKGKQKDAELAWLENEPMFTTSEILDFAAGADSTTEYDQ